MASPMRLSGGNFRAVGLAEFDAGDEAALADFVDERVGGFQGGEAGAQVVDFRGQAGERLFLLEDLEAGQGGGAAEGIGGVTMTIVERPLRPRRGRRRRLSPVVRVAAIGR